MDKPMINLLEEENDYKILFSNYNIYKTKFKL